MLHKNLRTVLYYVIGVTFICLMIEYRKKTDDDFYKLDKNLYSVVTASLQQLEAQPQETEDTDNEVIPLRNRGKEKPDFTSSKSKTPQRISNELKSKYREWKKEQVTKGKKVQGLYKQWKHDQGLLDEDNDEGSGSDPTKPGKSGKPVPQDGEDFKTWKLKNGGKGEDEKGLYKRWKVEKGLNKKNETKAEDGEDFKSWKKKNGGEEGDVLGLYKKWKAEKGLNKKKKVKELEDYVEIEQRKIESGILPDEPKHDEKEEEEDEEEKDGNKEEDLKKEFKEPVSEYTPPDPDHSCVNFTFTDELLKRAEDVREQCSRLGEEVADQSRMLSRLRWAVDERLLYCPVFKAASTTWLVNYLKLSGSKISSKVGNLHTRITNLFPAPSSFKLRKKIYDESLKFIIVRHPFERLVSAYRDKLAGFSRNPHYLGMRRLIISKYRKNSADNSTIPTFRESVDFVLDELKEMEKGSSTVNIDGHFMPYTRRCLPCGMDYDLIIKFESFEEDSNYIIKQCGLDDILSVTHENPAPTGPKTEQGYKNKSKKKQKKKSESPAIVDPVLSSALKTLQYFEEIPVSKIKQLYIHYKLDFEIFGYSADDYLSREDE